MFLEGILIVGLAGLVSCNNKNSIIKDVEYLNIQDTTVKLEEMDGYIVEYDSLGRIIQFKGNPVRYDKNNMVAGIGSHKVFYNEAGKIIRNQSYFIKKK